MEEFVFFMFHKGSNNFEVLYVTDQSFCFCSSLTTYTTVAGKKYLNIYQRKLLRAACYNICIVHIWDKIQWISSKIRGNYLVVLLMFLCINRFPPKGQTTQDCFEEACPKGRFRVFEWFDGTGRYPRRLRIPSSSKLLCAASMAAGHRISNIYRNSNFLNRILYVMNSKLFLSSYYIYC